MPKKFPGCLFLRTDGHRNFGDPYARNAVFYTPHIQITKDYLQKKNKKNYHSQALCEMIITNYIQKNRALDQATGRTVILHKKNPKGSPPTLSEVLRQR